jgi:hypothetical protein
MLFPASKSSEKDRIWTTPEANWTAVIESRAVIFPEF